MKEGQRMKSDQDDEKGGETSRGEALCSRSREQDARPDKFAQIIHRPTSSLRSHSLAAFPQSLSHAQGEEKED